MQNPATFGELRDVVDAGDLALRNPAGAIATLDIAESMLGPDILSAPLHAAHQLIVGRFPAEPHAELLSSFGGAPAYRRWRSFLLRILLLAGAGDVSDPFEALGTFADAHGLRRPVRRILERELPGVLPNAIGRGGAIAADRSLRGQRRWSFRNELSVLDRLRRVPAVQTLGLLGPVPIGKLPLYLDGDKARIPLPPRLERFAATLTEQDRRHLTRVFEIGVHAGVLEPAGDIDPRDLVSAALWDDLLDALDAALPKSGRIYLRSVLRQVRAIDRFAVPAGLNIRRRWNEAVLPNPTKSETPVSPAETRRLPAFICEAVDRFAAETGACRSHVKALRRTFRLLHEERAAGDMETLLHCAAERLDAQAQRFADGTFRVYSSALRRYLAHMGRDRAWPTLQRLSRAPGMPAVSARGLRVLETAASECEPPLDPAAIDRAMASKLISRARRRGQAHRVREGLADLDRLRPHLPDLLGTVAIGPLPDRRKRGNIDLPEHVRHALERHGRDAGFTPAGVKALRVAITKLYSATDDRSAFGVALPEIPFAKLLTEAVQDDPEAIEPYRPEILRLAERLGREWTEGWRDLQRTVVAAGVSRLDNPVEALARVAIPAGLEPWQLDREFAWTHERSLRPDLRLTWSANIDRFDALRACPAVARAGGLPPGRLGPMPPRGGRARHALYPLPEPVETAIAGEPKELLESVHFVWRFARDLGLYRRGDAPGPGDLFSDPILRRVVDGPHNLGRGSVRVHIDRVRGWRDDRIRAHVGDVQGVG